MTPVNTFPPGSVWEIESLIPFASGYRAELQIHLPSGAVYPDVAISIQGATMEEAVESAKRFIARNPDPNRLTP